MSNSDDKLSDIKYGPFRAIYSIGRSPDKLSRFYLVVVEIYHKEELIFNDDMVVTVHLHLTKGFYSDDLETYLQSVHGAIKSYIWRKFIEEDFTAKGLLCGQAQVLIKRVNNNLLELLYLK